jgi:hypothetical protein
MPGLDPRIALGTQAPQMRSPITTLQGLLALREHGEMNRQRQLMNEQRWREIDDDRAIRDSMAQLQDPDQAIDHLYRQGRVEAAGVLSKQVYAQRKAVADDAAQRIKTQKEQVEFGAQIIQSATDQASWDTARAALKTVLPQELFQHVQPLYDAAKQKQLVDWGTSVSDKLKSQQDAIDNANKAWDLQLRQASDYRAREKANLDAREFWNKSASSLLSTAHSQEEWDSYQRMLATQGAPADLLATFGNQFGPEAIARAKKLGMTPHEAEGVRQRDAEIKVQQQNANRLERDASAGSGRALTANRISEIDEWAQRQYAALEQELREEGADGSDAPPRTLGQLVRPDIGKRKLAIENAARTMKGLAPLEEAEARYAERPGSSAELAKIRRVYRELTGEEAPLQRMERLSAALQAERDPRRAGALRRTLSDLREEYRRRYGK